MDDGTIEGQEGGRVHRHELQGAEAAPGRRPRRHDEGDALQAAGRAAAAGRTDALGPRSVLSLQRAAGNAGVASLLADEDEASPVQDVVGKGGGSPIEPTTRSRMEASFGADFSDVRVHEGPAAAASAESVAARAYTVNNKIVLGDGSGPGSPAHERTLAHELTHVVQQRSGPVEGTPAPGGIALSDPGDRFERAAEATADTVMGGARAEAAPGPAGVQREEEEVQALAIQREAETEDEEDDTGVQALAIQRETAPDDEEEPLG